MGMYTELHFNCELRGDVPIEVVNALTKMLGGSPAQHCDIDHPLFKTGRWPYMLTCDSYYFAADAHSTLRMDELSKQYVLCVRCNLKNYDDEIEKFIDWIMPYVDAQPGEFLGFHRYEESNQPTLIHADDRVSR